jgi:hypothetical protein
MISASKSAISCNFLMISEGTSIECGLDGVQELSLTVMATLELRFCGSEAVLSPWILSLRRNYKTAPITLQSHQTLTDVLQNAPANILMQEPEAVQTSR